MRRSLVLSALLLFVLLTPFQSFGQPVGPLAPGEILVSEWAGTTIRRISPDGSSSSIFASGVPHAGGIAIEPDGSVVVVHSFTSLRRIAPDGTYTDFVTDLYGVSSVARAANGDLIVTQDLNPQLLRISSDGSSRIVIDGALKSEAVAVDPEGNINAAQEDGGNLWKYPPTGGRQLLFSGLATPSDVAIETAGTFVVAEYGTGTLRRIAPDGSWNQVIASGLTQVEGVAILPGGDLLVAENGPGRLRRVAADGTITDFFSGLNGADHVTVVPSLVEEVAIDIKPGTYPNVINLNAAGVIPVAILSSPSFNALDVDPATVSLAGATVKVAGKSDRYLSHFEDVNGDGLPDLVCQVYTNQLAVEPGTATAVLEAKTFGGRLLWGQDTIIVR